MKCFVISTVLDDHSLSGVIIDIHIYYYLFHFGPNQADGIIPLSLHICTGLLSHHEPSRLSLALDIAISPIRLEDL